jgi:hypothetical protein
MNESTQRHHQRLPTINLCQDGWEESRWAGSLRAAPQKKQSKPPKQEWVLNTADRVFEKHQSSGRATNGNLLGAFAFFSHDVASALGALAVANHATGAGVDRSCHLKAGLAFRTDESNFHAHHSALGKSSVRVG